VIINSPDPPAGGSGDNEFKNTQPPDFAKNACGIFSKIGGLIHFCHSIPALPVGMPMAKGQGY